MFGKVGGWGSGIAVHSLPSRASFFSSIHCFQRCNADTNTDRNTYTNTDTLIGGSDANVTISNPLQFQCTDTLTDANTDTNTDTNTNTNTYTNTDTYSVCSLV